MKLLYVCGTYAPGAFAGSELSAHELLQEISSKHAVEVLVVTDVRYSGGKPARSTYQGVPLYTVEHENRARGIAQAIAEFRPNAILTQLLWADVAMEVASAAGIPSILRLPDREKHWDFSMPSALIANAHSTCDMVRRRSGREVTYVPSAINLTRVVAPASVRDPRYIAMFNPIDIKGGEVFHAIAKEMSDRQFAVVPGWHSLRAEDGTWDRVVLRRSAESSMSRKLRDKLLHKKAAWTPRDVDFTDLANVEVLQPRANVAEIYAQIRVLLVPSQWKETLGRVAIEAFGNGIPVIASAVGGLADQVKGNGILVQDTANVAAWTAAIRSLDDPILYDRCSRQGRRFVETTYTMAQATEAFLAVFRRICQ